MCSSPHDMTGANNRTTIGDFWPSTPVHPVPLPGPVYLGRDSNVHIVSKPHSLNPITPTPVRDERTALMKVLDIVDPLPKEERDRLLGALAVYYGLEFGFEPDDK